MDQLLEHSIDRYVRLGRLIRERLTDYVRLGWLPESDVVPMSRLRTRTKALWHATWSGWPTFWATLRMQRALTELAYLRDSIAVGIVDAAGLEREKELLATVRELRPVALIAPTGRAPYPKLRERFGRRQATAYAPPAYPGPAGIGGSFPAPVGAPTFTAPGSAPLGQAATEYSEVDPTWAPPGGR